MDLQLSDRGAVVTGASRGIGLAAARALHAEGARVMLVARDEAALGAAVADLGERASYAVCDTTDDAQVLAMAERATAELGAVDVLVCSAAPANRGTITDDQFDFMMDVKVKGYLRCARAFAPGMAERGFGRIVNVAGLAARTTGSVVGTIRNVAVSAMTKNLADEYGRDGVNVTVVHPGMTVTDSYPESLAAMARARGTAPEELERTLAARTSIGRIVTAEEIADVIAFLCSPRSVAVTGDWIGVGGGDRGRIHY